MPLTRVAIGEKGADREQDLGDGECGTPLVPKDVQADDPLTVDVAVVDASAKCYLKCEPLSSDR